MSVSTRDTQALDLARVQGKDVNAGDKRHGKESITPEIQADSSSLRSYRSIDRTSQDTAANVDNGPAVGPEIVAARAEQGAILQQQLDSVDVYHSLEVSATLVRVIL